MTENDLKEFYSLLQERRDINCEIELIRDRLQNLGVDSSGANDVAARNEKMEKTVTLWKYEGQLLAEKAKITNILSGLCTCLGDDTVTLKDFEQITYIRDEIQLLNKRLSKLKAHNYVTDYAKDYSTGYARPISISGYEITDKDKVNEVLDIISRRKETLERKLVEAEKYIDSVPDSRIRTLLTLRFIEGESWEDIAKQFYKGTADAIRKTVTRYFEDNI